MNGKNMVHPGLRDIELLLEGELRGTEKRRVGEHLRSCPACREEAAEHQALLAAFSSLPVLEPPDGLAALIMKRLPAPSAEEALSPALPAAASADHRSVRPTLAAAASLALALPAFIFLVIRLAPGLISSCRRDLSFSAGEPILIAGRLLGVLAALVKAGRMINEILGRWLGDILRMVPPHILALTTLAMVLAAAAAFFGLKHLKIMESDHEK